VGTEVAGVVVVVAAVVAATTISRTRGAEGTMMMAIRVAEGLPGAVIKEGTKAHQEVSSCAAVAAEAQLGPYHGPAAPLFTGVL
jgi:hypothetical protein